MPRNSLLALPFAAASLLASPGCLCGNSCFDFLSNVAAEGLILGLEDPVEGIDLGAATGATVFLAEAESLNDIESNLLDDADLVQVVSGSMGAVELTAVGNGLYEATSDESPGLVYSVGATYRLQVQDGGEVFEASGTAPAPPVLEGLPDAGTHPAGGDITIDLSAGNFDNYLAVVADDAGNVTYDNRPDTAGDYVDWIRGTGVSSITIPGSAFPAAATGYVLGVAGIRKGSEFDGFNPLVSNLALGSLTVEAVATAP